jgi:hypothetical protein
MPSIIKDWLSRRLLGRETELPQPKFTYKAPARPLAEPFHAVSIKPGLKCCEAARQFGQHRFLSAKAPRLPLPGCDVSQCACRYTHFSDRRAGIDRRAGYDPAWPQRINFPNRRRAGGRRASDSPA